MLKVKLFGPGQATYLDRPLLNFPLQQPHLLLCYLLLNSKHPHLRDQLANIFWGDYPTRTSRKYLRNGLWKLRLNFEDVQASLDEFLLVGDESITFLRDSPYWLDVEAFEAAIETCRDIPGEALTASQAASLQETVELYTGDLMEGTYADWCLYERERLSALYLSTLSKLMAYHEMHGSYERGLSYGEKILSRDNTREKVHLQMMRLYWLAGDRNAAMVQYKRCVQALWEGLGISPLHETSATYQQMITNQYVPVQRLSRIRRTGEVDPTLQSRAEKALNKLQYLQEMLEETRAELKQIESQIRNEGFHP